MLDTGNQEKSKYLIFLQRDEKTKSYNVINILTYREIIDMRDYDLKNDNQKENIKNKILDYATFYRIIINQKENFNKVNDTKYTSEQEESNNKLLNKMLNSETQNSKKPFLIDFDGEYDIVLLDIVNDFDESRNITLIPIEIDKGNYIMPRMYNIPNQIYKENFESRSEANLINNFNSNSIKNVNFKNDNFNQITENIKNKTITNVDETIKFLNSDINEVICGYSLKKVNNMIQINSNCFGIIDKNPLKINSWVNPNIQNITQKNLKNKPSSAAKSDPGATSNISYAINNSRNVRTAPSVQKQSNKTQKNPKTTFR
jgi:isochorismate hydrolase